MEPSAAMTVVRICLCYCMCLERVDPDYLDDSQLHTYAHTVGAVVAHLLPSVHKLLETCFYAKPTCTLQSTLPPLIPPLEEQIDSPMRLGAQRDGSPGKSPRARAGNGGAQLTSPAVREALQTTPEIDSVFDVLQKRLGTLSDRIQSDLGKK